MDQEYLHQRLLEPSFYPEQPSSVAFQETHISRVYLLDTHVYKMKKPVNLGFLDFSTLERRHHYCEEEVRLNRSFCPDTYREVIPVCADKGTVHLGLPGDIIEYLVKMRRLPEDRMLHAMLIRQDAGLSNGMTALGLRLAQLHAETSPCNHDEGYSDLMHVRRNWDENFRQTEPFVGSTISPEGYLRLRGYVHHFLETNDAMLVQREQDGWVRECHGDLHAEHVCMTDPICIFDCIEFNRRFRVSDIAADIAFLLMDLDRHHRRDLSARLWKAYSENLTVPPPEDLLRFYKVYRACVRGKVSSILSSGETVPADHRARAHHDALNYFNLALGYLMPQALLITCGLMGTGKTTFAEMLAPLLPASVIRSDVIRLQFKDRPNAPDSAGFLEGPYRPELTDHVYRQLAEQARQHLGAGRSVLLDASFSTAEQRHRMQKIAVECHVPFGILHCQCTREVALSRLNERRQQQTDVSDGRAELYDLQATRFQPPGPEEPVITVNTASAVDYAANIALGLLPDIITRP